MNLPHNVHYGCDARKDVPLKLDMGLDSFFD